MKKYYEKLAAYSITPGLIIWIYIQIYAEYTNNFSPRFFTEIILVDSIIQVLVSIFGAIILSLFWLGLYELWKNGDSK